MNMPGIYFVGEVRTYYIIYSRKVDCYVPIYL